MNTFMEQQTPIISMTLDLRAQMLDLLTDEDLAYTLPGQNVSLGAMCKRHGEVQHSYLESFRSGTMDYGYHNPDAKLATSVSALKAWFKEMNEEMLGLLNNMSDEAIQTTMVDRGHGVFPAAIQFHIFKEALLIFYGQADIYLKALDKPLTQQWQDWIG